MIIKAFLSKKSIQKENELSRFGKENYVKEIDFPEYIYIFNKFDFINISHTQAPGYYLKEESPKYLKVYNENGIVAITAFVKKRVLKILFKS